MKLRLLPRRVSILALVGDRNDPRQDLSGSPAGVAVVAADCDYSTDVRRYVLRPNRSITWRGVTLLLGSILALYLIMGMAFAAVGLWLILPFAGLEFIALWYCFYLSFRKTEHCQVITIAGESVKVESGRRAPEITEQFQRSWAQVRLARSAHRWYPSRLVIRSHGREVEVGGFLSEDERLDLAEELQRVIAPLPALATT